MQKPTAATIVIAWTKDGRQTHYRGRSYGVRRGDTFLMACRATPQVSG